MGDFLFGDSGVRVVDQCGEIACLLSLTWDRAAFVLLAFTTRFDFDSLSAVGMHPCFGCRVSGFLSFYLIVLMSGI